MITRTEMATTLKEADALNLGSLKLMQADLFAEVINQAMPEATRDQARRAVLTLAGNRTTGQRGQFLTPGDLLTTMREMQAGDLELQRARLREEISRNGKFIAEGIEDTDAEVRWRQEATRAFMNGASRSQAEMAAWAAIGQLPPQVEPTQNYEIPTIGKAI